MENAWRYYHPEQKFHVLFPPCDLYTHQRAALIALLAVAPIDEWDAASAMSMA